jgi:hypothetical protein
MTAVKRVVNLDAYQGEPRCLSWRVSALVLLAAVVAGNAVLILGAVR